MSHNKRGGYGIAKYFERIGEEAKEGPTQDPSRMSQLSRIEGTGQGEAGPTHTNTHTNIDTNTSTKDKDGGSDNTDDKEYGTESNDRKKENANAYAYGGTKGDRKGKRDARLGPHKIKSPQNAAPSDDEVT